MIRVKFIKRKEVDLICSILTWGITGDIVQEASSRDTWRKCFGPKRYAVCGAKQLVCKCKAPNYWTHVYYQNREVEDENEVALKYETELNEEDVQLEPVEPWTAMVDHKMDQVMTPSLSSKLISSDEISSN